MSYLELLKEKAPSALGAVRQRMGASDENDSQYDYRLSDMDEYDVLDAYLKWNGIHGYTGKILALTRLLHHPQPSEES